MHSRKLVLGAAVCVCVGAALAGSSRADQFVPSVDQTFGTNGYSLVAGNPAGGYPSSAGAVVALQPDGKIIAAGLWGSGSPLVVRLLADGSLDASYGTGGRVFPNNIAGYATAGALDAAGRLVVAGRDFNNGWWLARIDSSGNLDPTFGSGGEVLGQVFVTSSYPESVGFDAAGRIYLGGMFNSNSVIRYSPAGVFDNHYGNGFGFATTTFTTAGDILVDPDGSVYDDALGDGLDLGVVRLTPSGVADSSYGSNGFAHLALSGDQRPGALVRADDGSIIVVGTTGDFFDGVEWFGSPEILAAHFLNGGAVDTSWGGAGTVAIPMAHQFGFRKVSAGPNGAIWITGVTSADNGFTLTVPLIAGLSCNGSVALSETDGLAGGGISTQPNGDVITLGQSSSLQMMFSRLVLTPVPAGATPAGGCNPGGASGGGTGGGGSGGGGGGGDGGGGSSGPLDLSVSVSASPERVDPGGSATFFVEVTDLTATPANNLHVTVNLPAGAGVVSTYADRGPGCMPGTEAGTLDCGLDYLSGDTLRGHLTIVLSLPGPGSAALTATAHARQGELNVANNTASATVLVGAPEQPASAPPLANLPQTSSPAHVMHGTAGSNHISGTTGSDSIYAGAGNDVINGGKGNDGLWGGPGADRITGGAGLDHIYGGAGNDVIYAHDRQRDVIDCGPGHDIVYADRNDKVAKNCEKTLRS